MATFYLQVWAMLLAYIVSGEKDLEVRTNTGKFTRVRIGDRLVFNDSCTRYVADIRRYASFADMQRGEADNRARIGPGESWETILNTLRRMHRSDQEAKGVLVFELEQ